MSTHPICRACPNCGSGEYFAVKPDRLVTFMKDRECKNCYLRYTPPTPFCATLLLILIGGVLTLGCGYSIILALARGHIFALPLNALFAFVGVLCLRLGAYSIRQRPLEPPEHTADLADRERFRYVKPS